MLSVADPGFAKGGTDHGERAERESKRGSGGGAPSGVQGQSPWWGSGGRSPLPLKLKAFCQFHSKKWPKVKYLNENLLSCLRQAAAMTSPKFGSMGGLGGRRPVRP